MKNRLFRFIAVFVCDYFVQAIQSEVTLGGEVIKENFSFISKGVN